MTKRWWGSGPMITKAFKIEPEAWAEFEKVAQSYETTSAELLRELIRHVDTAMEGVKTGLAQSTDVAQLIKVQFPQLSPLQLRRMGNILMQAAEVKQNDTL